VSIFDRLGNLGKGIIQSTLNPDTPGASGNTDRQEQLKRAFDQGLLTAEEYRNKLREMSARLAARARGEDPDAVAPASASQAEPDPVAAAIRRARTATSRAASEPEAKAEQERTPSKRTLDGDSGDVGEEREWESRGPAKRTL